MSSHKPSSSPQSISCLQQMKRRCYCIPRLPKGAWLRAQPEFTQTPDQGKCLPCKLEVGERLPGTCSLLLSSQVLYTQTSNPLSSTHTSCVMHMPTHICTINATKTKNKDPTIYGANCPNKFEWHNSKDQIQNLDNNLYRYSLRLNDS